MNRHGLLPTDSQRLRTCILLTLVLACLLIAATVLIYQKRLQRLRQKLNEGNTPVIGCIYPTHPHSTLNNNTFIHPTIHTT